MDAELKARWVEALRSGSYLQGTGRLKHDGRFCCLGVLCEITGLHEQPGPVDLCGQITRDFHLDTERQEILIEMNDSGTRSFSDIATYIEENL